MDGFQIVFHIEEAPMHSIAKRSGWLGSAAQLSSQMTQLSQPSLTCLPVNNILLHWPSEAEGVLRHTHHVISCPGKS